MVLDSQQAWIKAYNLHHLKARVKPAKVPGRARRPPARGPAALPPSARAEQQAWLCSSTRQGSFPDWRAPPSFLLWTTRFPSPNSSSTHVTHTVKFRRKQGYSVLSLPSYYCPVLPLPSIYTSSSPYLYVHIKCRFKCKYIFILKATPWIWEKRCGICLSEPGLFLLTWLSSILSIFPKMK